MIENRQILCIGSADWDNPFKTNQHRIMELLSLKNEVLFIESLGLRRPVLQKKDISRILRRLLKFFGGVQKSKNGINVYSPLVIPFHKYSWLRKLNDILLYIQIKKLIKKLQYRDILLWSYVPNAVMLLNKLDISISVYHCVDELSANPLIPVEIKEYEKDYLKKADITFVTSLGLLKSKEKYAKSVFYMPNVADFKHFNKSLSVTDIPEDIKAIKGVKLGFFGAVSSYKLNFELIKAIAENDESWNVILIGPSGEGEREADLANLKKYKNIHIMGPKNYSIIPKYLAAFDVCLLPSLLNEYTRHMFPLKFFEYLSSGKPIVSTNLDSLKEHSSLCYISKSNNEFVDNIKAALAENDKRLKELRINTAMQNTWEMRVESMSSKIFEIDKQKGQK